MASWHEVERLGLPEGYSLQQKGGSSHLAVIRPDGLPLRMPNGIPLVVSLTPSDYRTRRTERARIRRALETQEASQ